MAQGQIWAFLTHSEAYHHLFSIVGLRYYYCLSNNGTSTFDQFLDKVQENSGLGNCAPALKTAQ